MEVGDNIEQGSQLYWTKAFEAWDDRTYRESNVAKGWGVLHSSNNSIPHIPQSAATTHLMSVGLFHSFLQILAPSPIVNSLALSRLSKMGFLQFPESWQIGLQSAAYLSALCLVCIVSRVFMLWNRQSMKADTKNCSKSALGLSWNPRKQEEHTHSHLPAWSSSQSSWNSFSLPHFYSDTA